MSMPNRSLFMMAGFFVPVLFCLIGIGAFVHLILPIQEETPPAPIPPIENKNAQALEDIEKRILEEEGNIRVLKQEHDQALMRSAEADRNQRVLRDLENVSAEMQEELEEIQEKAKAVEEANDQARQNNQRTAKLKAQKTDLGKAMREADTELKKLANELVKRQENRGKFSAMSLYGGTSNCRRIPIFAECRGESLIIQPEGLTLGREPTPNDKSLILALTKRVPYIVFFIRPDGFEIFEKYRGFLLEENAKSQIPVDIGYEPVDRDWVLVYPDKD